MIFCVTPPLAREVQNLDCIYANFCSKEFLAVKRTHKNIFNLKEANARFEKFLSSQLNMKLPYVFYSPTLASVRILDWDKFGKNLLITAYNYPSRNPKEFFIAEIVKRFSLSVKMSRFFSNLSPMEFNLRKIFGVF